MSGTLFLVRGLPGSGKTSFATHIWNEYAVVEADKYFYDKEGNYNYDPTKIKDAHSWCKKQVETMMQDHQLNEQYYPEIAVSNTFTQEWEMKDYFDLADKYGYKVVSLIVENRHGSKNIHGVPDDKLEIMKNRFEVKL